MDLVKYVGFIQLLSIVLLQQLNNYIQYLHVVLILVNVLPQVLLTLPPAARQDYFPLLSDPLLMLEQLLMNLKVDWAEVAVRTLRSLLVGQEAGFSVENIDKLLSEYARKALDFSCAPRERSRSGQCFCHM